MGQDNLAPEGTTEVGLTRFYVLTASEDLSTFTHVATVEAAGRDQAIRKHFGRVAPVCVAVSEHAWKVRRPKVERVVRGLDDVEMPDPGGTHPPDAEADLGPVDDDAVASGAEEVPPVEVLGIA